MDAVRRGEAGQKVHEIVFGGYFRPDVETPQRFGKVLPKKDSDVRAGLHT